MIVNEAEDRHFRDGPLTGSSTDNAASDQWIKMIEKIRQMETNLTQFPVENTAQGIKRQSHLQSTNNAPVYETKHKNQFCIKFVTTASDIASYKKAVLLPKMKLCSYVVSIFDMIIFFSVLLIGGRSI